MSFFSNLFRRAGIPREAKPVDDDRKGLLLSAAGTVGADLDEFVSKLIHEEEGDFFVATEAGFLGIAAASHFYVVRYAKNQDIVALASFLFSAYRDFYFERNVKQLDPKWAQALDEYYRNEGLIGVTEYARRLMLHARDPDAALDELVSLFASRLESKAGFTIDEPSKIELRRKLMNCFDALMLSFRTLLG